MPAWFDRGVAQRRRVLLVEAAVWGVLLWAGYLALVSPLSGGEFILGALLSAIAGGAAVLARRASGSSFAVPQHWVGALLRLPGAVISDTWLLARLVWTRSARRRTIGQLQRLELAEQPDEFRDTSWQAVAGLLLSLSPGSFVVDSSGHPPTLLVHTIRAEAGSLERVIQR
jgi:multisubunit Na+/H+ antiporter MnhE subunit